MVTKAQALAATHGDIFHSTCLGPCRRAYARILYRVTGRCRTWKTRPLEYRLPVKHGLYTSAAITDQNASLWHAAIECPLNFDLDALTCSKR